MFNYYRLDDVKQIVYHYRFDIFKFNFENKELLLSDECHLVVLTDKLFKIYNMLGFIDDYVNDVRNENTTIEYLEGMSFDEITYADGVLYLRDF